MLRSLQALGLKGRRKSVGLGSESLLLGALQAGAIVSIVVPCLWLPVRILNIKLARPGTTMETIGNV